jgi:hypothetical protein
MPIKKAKKPSRPPHRAPAKAPEQESKRSGGKGGKPFDNTNRGVLFPNDKDGNEKRPDYTGNADIKIPDGAKPGQVIKFRLSGWVKEYAGGKLLSLTVQKADKQGNSKPKSSEDDSESEDEGGLLD